MILSIFFISSVQSLTLDQFIATFNYSYSNGSISIINQSDYMIDTNANGMNDTLIINLTSIVSADAVYNSFVKIFDNGTLVINNTNVTVTSTAPEIIIRFPSKRLQTRKFNYSIEILDKDSNLVFRSNRIESKLHPAYEQGIVLKNISSRKTSDLQIDLGINTSASEKVNVSVILTYNDSFIAATRELTLANGQQIVDMHLDNQSITSTHIKGNFTITEVVIGTKSFKPNINSTFVNFEQYANITYLNYSVYGLKDTNGNSFADNLEINFSIIVKKAGSYRIFYNLYDGDGNYISNISKNQTLSLGKQIVQTLVNGTQIYKTNFDGPYFIDFAKLYAGDNLTDLLPNALEANISSYTIFEAPPRPDLNVSIRVLFNSTQQKTNITVNITNLGKIQAANVFLDLYDNSTFYSNQTLSFLSENKSIVYYYNLTGTTQLNQYTAVVDFSNVVDETNETNNVAQNIVPDAPQLSNTSIGPSSPTTWSSTLRVFFNVTVTDNDGISRVFLSFNNVNYTMFNKSSRYHYNLTSLSAGTYSYYFWANDTLGNKNQISPTNYIISKATPGISLQVTGPGTYNPSSNTTATGSGCPTGLTCTLYFNRTAQTNPYKAILAAGVYNFTYNTTGNQNYSNRSVSTVRTIAKNTSQVTVWVDLARLNKTIYPGTSIWLNATKQLGEGSIQLYRNNTLINTGASNLKNFSLFSTLGLYNITAKYPATQNYTETSSILFVNVTKQPGLKINLVYPTTNINVTQNSKFNVTVNVTCTSSTCLDMNVSLDPIPSPTPPQPFIGQSGKRWSFETMKEDEFVEVIIDQISNTEIKLTLTPKEDVKLPNNYKWSMALCNLQGITTLQYAEESSPNTKRTSQFKKLNQNGLPSDWCADTNNDGFEIIKDAVANKLSQSITLYLPEDSREFMLYAGSGSVQIYATVSDTATEAGFNEKLCVGSNGIFHTAFIDAAGDLQYANSTSASNWSVTEIRTGDLSFPGTICAPNGNLWIYYIDELNELNLSRSNNSGASFGLFTGTSITNDVRYPVCAVDSNSIVHCCIVDSTAAEKLYYINSSDATNEREINSNSADGVEFCDIEVDMNNNVYIIGQGGDQDDLDIWSSKNNWTRTEIFNGAVTSSFSSGYSLALTISKNNNIYAAFIEGVDLEYCKGSTANLSAWSCQTLDPLNTYHPDIAVSENEEVYILYQDDPSTDSGHVLFANSSDGITFNTHQDLLGSTSGWGSIAESRFGSSNRITDKMHFVYTSGNAVYYNSFDTRYVAPKTGLVSTITGDTPFFTNSSNPTNTTILGGQSKIITWWVNATGPKASYEFFAFANLTYNMSVSNVTNRVNITII